MPDAPVAGPVKKHITTACNCCRKRKVKCDGSAPACSNCVLYGQECTYKLGEDRRKLSLKKTNQALSERIKLLESLLRSNGIEVPNDSGPGTPTSDSQAVDSIVKDPSVNASTEGSLEQPGFDLGQTSPNNTHDWMSNLPDSTNGGHQPAESDWETLMRFDSGAQMPPPTVSRQPKSSSGKGFVERSGLDQETPSSFGFNLQPTGSDAAISFDEDEPNFSAQEVNIDPTLLRGGIGSKQKRRESSVEWHNDNTWSNQHIGSRMIEPVQSAPSDEMVDQLSARMGSFQLAEDGQLRYFGATSNLHILHNGAFSLSITPTRSIRTEGNATLHRAGVGHTVDTEFEKHLEWLYFKWEDPAIHVVDEDMYYAEQERWNSGEDGSPFYSETLKNAICAVGANLSTRSTSSLPEPVAEFFSARAKLLLEIEMDSPTVATVQALVVMSASEAAFTRDARGWIYSGMAVRLSADLGLHLDLSDHVREGRLTARELDVRRTTFWGVFVHDNMWSLYVGRPWGINIRDISIPRPPREQDKIKQKLWKANPEVAGDETGILDPIEACADSNVSLCEMMRRLSRTLYAGRSLPDEALHNFASDMRKEFDNWHHNLPIELAVNLSLVDQAKLILPHILQLHMQFYAISIFLHRPFFSRVTGPGNSDIQEVSRQAQRSCVEAAQKMVQLLRIFRKQHTLRQTNVQIVHLIFTASLIHIYNTCTSTGKEAERAMSDLQFCCQSLTEIGQAYKNSTRALEVIICIKREWQNKAKTARLKRPNSAFGVGTDTNMHSKRRMTDNNQYERPVLEGNQVSHAKGGEVLEQDSWHFTNEENHFLETGSFDAPDYSMMGSFPDTSFAYGYLNTMPPNQ